MRMLTILLAATAAAGCDRAKTPAAAGNEVTANGSVAAVPVSLARLDCGKIRIKNFDKFFSDKPGLYAAEPRDVTDSCYLIRHGDRMMLWDTGLSADLKGGTFDTGESVMSLDSTLAEQLAQAGIKPEDVDVIGLSHHHADHTGQAALFPNARLIVGAGDFEEAKAPPPQGGPSPIAPWLKDGAKVTKATTDVDIFGDGSVVAIHLPGHTPDHMSLLVRLKSGPVLLTGDLYHSTEARAKRGVPPFNSSREQTLASMDLFERMARDYGAKVVIQHEPRDIGKLPAVSQSAP